ncbi:MAG: response regulator [Nitratireductor sp.]|nr:response regulator [Nitratireductor sp.]
MRILLVEDNQTLAEGLIALLRGGSNAVDHVSDGEAAETAILNASFDLIILDLSLPDKDGLDILQFIRSRGNTTPVLILTARGALDDRVRGLDIGADDYMTKPFEIRELEARVRVLLRRKAGLGASLVSLGTLHLDLATGTLLADDEAVDLTRRELSILESLMLARGRVVQKQALLEKIGGYDEDLSENAIEQSVSRLRRRLQPHGASIRVARGLGYWLETSGQ